MTATPFTTCLWFDTEAEEAARFYLGIFKDSKLGTIQHYPEVGPRPTGMVMTVEFELNGQQFMALNGGPENSFNPAVSLMVWCENQAEVDHYWERLTDGGEEIACGWLKDRYGLHWQIVPRRFFELMRTADEEKTNRLMGAMMKMTKLDAATLEAAAEEPSQGEGASPSEGKGGGLAERLGEG
jgi:predicted 3-demethylubiquinone-9 3-methyltransferase (glyoxalase superfamily)